MSRVRLALWIARREVVAAGSSGGAPCVVLRVARPTGTSACAALQGILSSLSAEWHAADVRLVLSAGDVACADCFEVPFKTESEIEDTAASLAEGRCAGESAEELAIAIRQAVRRKDGSCVHALALKQAQLKELRDVFSQALPSARLTLISSALPLLSSMLTQDGFYVLDARAAGEVLSVLMKDGVAQQWASCPRGHSEVGVNADVVAQSFGNSEKLETFAGEISLKANLKAPPEFAVAYAALECEPAQVLNILAIAPDAQKASTGRLRGAWMRTAVAAMLLFGAAGFYFDTVASRAAQALEIVDAKERELWKQRFPSKQYLPGALHASMTKMLADHTKGEGANQFPSALGFWGEMVAHMPNPEQVGLSIESLQLSHDGGRLVGHVDKASDDVLKNASMLEAHLNTSKLMQTRGEYETRDKDIVVRLRMDYQPKMQSAAQSGGVK